MADAVGVAAAPATIILDDDELVDADANAEPLQVVNGDDDAEAV